MEENEEINKDLQLDDLICFKLYLASRLTTKLYKKILSDLNLTYPQYLVMLVLWETDNIQIKTISEKLYLNTNTLTPLLKRMEAKGLITRTKSNCDERQILINLTNTGEKLKSKVNNISSDMHKYMLKEGNITSQDILDMKKLLDKFTYMMLKEDSSCKNN